MSVTTSFRHSLLHTAAPIMKMAGHLHWPYSQRYLNGLTVYEMQPLMTPGTILCSRIRGEPSNLLQPSSFWTHSAMYLVYNDIPCVLEATSQGVHITDFISFVTSKDYIAAIEPQTSDSIRERATEEGLLLRGLPYDYLLDGGNRAFYCSEVVWYSYEQAFQKIHNTPFFFVPRERLGVPTISPQDFVDAAATYPINKFKITYIRTTDGKQECI